jgi:hypothetical protein
MEGVNKDTPPSGMRSEGCDSNHLPRLLVFPDPRCSAPIVICMKYWWKSMSDL